MAGEKSPIYSFQYVRFDPDLMELQVGGKGMAACIPVDMKLSENPIYFDRLILKDLEKEYRATKEVPQLVAKKSAVWNVSTEPEHKISVCELDGSFPMGSFPSVKTGMFMEINNCDFPQWETKKFDLKLPTCLFAAAKKIPEASVIEARIITRGIEYKVFESKPSSALVLHAVLLGLADEE